MSNLIDRIVETDAIERRSAPSVSFAHEITEAIRCVVGNGPVALHEPTFRGNEWTYVKECLDTTFVSSVGPFVDRFEAELANYTGARYAVAVVNGTAALHMALLLAGVRPGDEVLMPALTFVATANAVAYCGAVPHFADSEERSLGIDAIVLRDYLASIADVVDGTCLNRRTGRVIRALLPMHVFGHPADIDGLLSVARDFRLALIEDAAESLGSFYKGRHTGTFGLLGTLSFNGNKTVTTGGGGAILTGDADLARRAKHLTTTAKVPHPWAYEHDEVGYNYRMPNLNAALGCAQLERLPNMIEAKRSLYCAYRDAFSNLADMRIAVEPEGCRSNYWLQTLVLAERYASERDVVITETNAAGLMTRPAWTLMHRLPAFKDAPAMPLLAAESLERRIVNLPSSAHLVRQ